MNEKSPLLKLTVAARQFWLGGVSVHGTQAAPDLTDRGSVTRSTNASQDASGNEPRSSRLKNLSRATNPRFSLLIGAFTLLLLSAGSTLADSVTTNSISTASPASLPDAGASLVRVFGALILVIALFLGGVWLFRNWQRLATQKSGGAKLNLLEVKSLGQRQSLYVVGYQQQRLLLASSPAGVTLVSHLPAADEDESIVTAPKLSFAEAFQHVLNRKQ